MAFIDTQNVEKREIKTAVLKIDFELWDIFLYMHVGQQIFFFYVNYIISNLSVNFRLHGLLVKIYMTHKPPKDPKT